MTVAKTHFQPRDVVWVPFPFVEAPRLRERPALVVNVQSPSKDITLLWVLMITSAANKGWRGDVSLEERYHECGLEVPCVIRTAKITTVDGQRARKCGTLPDDLFAVIRAQIANWFS